MNSKQYMYLSVSGDLAFKDPWIVGNPDDYFDSPCVAKWWPPAKNIKTICEQLGEALEISSDTDITRMHISKILKDLTGMRECSKWERKDG